MKKPEHLSKESEDTEKKNWNANLKNEKQLKQKTQQMGSAANGEEKGKNQQTRRQNNKNDPIWAAQKNTLKKKWTEPQGHVGL